MNLKEVVRWHDAEASAAEEKVVKVALMRGNSSLESHIRRKSEGKANH